MNEEDRKIYNYWVKVIDKYKKTPPKNSSEEQHLEHAKNTIDKYNKVILKKR